MPSSVPLHFSVDASAFIELKAAYPATVFASLWGFLGERADSVAIRVADPVCQECQDAVLVDWFRAHPQSVVSVDQALADLVAWIHRDLAAINRQIIDPNSTRHQADPWVVALALKLGNRQLPNPGQGEACSCAVITYEHSHPDRRVLPIPDVCRRYGIRCANSPEFLMQIGWRC